MDDGVMVEFVERQLLDLVVTSSSMGCFAAIDLSVA